MTKHSHTELQALAQLRADFPGWRFLLSDRRRWWAMRGPLPPDRVSEVDALDADSPEKLRAELGKVGR
ncbi:hypothetical protein [Actinomadura rudentiformis]|uniref:Uncharacterized protein n=1 Tax=Actinomadura rudentiformis TaxID=359158 RepID=A0A6H9Z4R6_9ACTN|nr:hypothetical protein [Actinomadura rudentiformis]KAB2348482.1 hypothetical protein F8566_17005 [Actinomadura rudentiformis]